MSASAFGPGPSFEGARHRARPARPVYQEPATEPPRPEFEPPQLHQAPRPELDACPWLYLSIEPDTRGASVTDQHRCELAPGVTPGPGHQVAYCLTTNHRACPQLRGYEAQRRAAALQEQQQAEILPFPAPFQPAPQPPRPRRTRGGGRWLWAALGAVGALVLAGAIWFYTLPGLPLSEPDAAPAATASPPAGAVSAATEAPAPAIAVTPDRYVVQLGDTLSSIARRFDVSVDALIQANHLEDGSLLVDVGDQLVIPAP